MIGYLKNGIYVNGYNNPIACFICNENKCKGTKSFSLPFGGNGELIYCEAHEKEAIQEVNKRSGNNTRLNLKVSNS
jgi:hypothetical protein